MPETTADFVKQSVTSADYSSQSGGVFYLSFPHHWHEGAMPPNLIDVELRQADRILSSTPEFEAMWAAALFIAKTKTASAAWEVSGDIPLRVKRAQELLHNADLGRGWVPFLEKHLQDFLCTNNGAFVEIVRQGRSLNSQIVSLAVLDSLRCMRTEDPSIPVIYTDLKGRQHELKEYEVIALADEPSPRASLLGMGRCAAARAYRTIYNMYCIETYISEKISGRRPLAISFVNGLNTQQLQDVLRAAQSQADATGIICLHGRGDCYYP